MDALDKEIDVVKQYLTIIGSHYNDVIEVEWIIDDKLLSKRIPKNIIQPLVENAVFHGLTNDQGEIKGRVSISIQEDDENNIVIRVSDNGNGMSEEQLEAFREKYTTRATDRGLHVGLNNIRRRLIFLFGNEDCLKIDSRINAGTTVTLTFKPE
jgi:sensor histidine kinase YesM